MQYVAVLDSSGVWKRKAGRCLSKCGQWKHITAHILTQAGINLGEESVFVFFSDLHYYKSSFVSLSTEHRFCRGNVFALSQDPPRQALLPHRKFSMVTLQAQGSIWHLLT